MQHHPSPFRASWTRWFGWLWLSGLLTLLLANAAVAQGFGGSMLPELELRNQGWAQLKNLEEIADFAVGLIEISVLTLLVGYHPVRLHTRRSKSDYDQPRVLFLYALIGMTVGFLVLHHGYIIGFVIFGMGGLLRFRGDSTSTADTTRLILMTVLGLCIGLDLPVYAFMATISAWLIIFFLSRSEKLELEVKLDSDVDMQEAIEDLKAALAERGFRTLGVIKAKFKSEVQLVVVGPQGDQRHTLMQHMAELQKAKSHPVEDWHIS